MKRLLIAIALASLAVGPIGCSGMRNWFRSNRGDACSPSCSSAPMTYQAPIYEGAVEGEIVDELPVPRARQK